MNTTQENNALDEAHAIVARCQTRLANGATRLPRVLTNALALATPEGQRERRDADLLRAWREARAGQGNRMHYAAVGALLDARLPEWDDEEVHPDDAWLQQARDIVARAHARQAAETP